MPITWLFERMKQWSDDPAMIWQDQPFTYKNILEGIEIWSNELEAQGVHSGSVVGLEGDYSLNVCALLLVLIQRKAIIVPLTEAVGTNREDFIKTAEVQLVFTFDAKDNWNIEKRNVKTTNSLIQKLIKMAEPGLVLFSSGSTGKNKAALHNFSKLLEKFKKLRHRLCTINFLLFDHIGGINTLFYTLSNGGTVVTTRDRDPDKICRLIEKYKVELLPTSPTFLNLLLISDAYKNYDLSSLKMITYGTEMMPESLLKRLNKTFPTVRFLQTYGLSELGILRSKSKESDSLWVKVGGEGFETKVVDRVLWIRAHSAMMGYINASNPFDEDGWMNTEDIVEVKDDYIRILGRETDIINVGGQKVYPAEVESILMQMENITDANVRGESNPITGNIVVAQLTLENPEELSDLKKRVRKYCKERLENFKVPVKIEITENFHYTNRFKKVRFKN